MTPGRNPIGALDAADLAEAFAADQPYTRHATINLADGRVLNVSGTFSRDSLDRNTGRAGQMSARCSFTFPTDQCEDVATGDGVRILDVDYTVKGPPTFGGPLTTLTLQRSA